jgi:hypothetical protein
LLGVKVSQLPDTDIPTVLVSSAVVKQTPKVKSKEEVTVDTSEDVFVPIEAGQEQPYIPPTIKHVKATKVGKPKSNSTLATVTPIELGRTPPNSPAFGTMMLWDRLMRKPSPTQDWSEWVNHPEYALYIFLPNDLAKGEANAESTLTNGYYMQVVLAVYQDMCARAKFSPEVVLTNGEVRKVVDLTPLDNIQPGVLGEVSAKLCNSKLARGYDDSLFRSHLLLALKSLNPDDYENAQVYHSVAARLENIVTGERDNLTNAEVARKLFDLVEVSISDSQSPIFNKPSILTTVIGVLNALRDEGCVLQESGELFKRRLYVAGSGAYSQFLHDLYVMSSEVDHIDEIDYD